HTYKEHPYPLYSLVVRCLPSLAAWFPMANQLPVQQQVNPLGHGDLNQQRMCAPRQRNLNNVPVIHLDIGRPPHGEDDDLAQRYEDFVRIIIRRLTKICPATYYGKPITPYPNAANHPTEGHSYFRVVFFSSTNDYARVEFLIRDFDLYLLGLRRQLDGEWSPWYRFTPSLGWPSFPMGEVVNYRFDGGHEHKVDMGGRETLEFIFDTIWTWHLNDVRSTNLKLAVEKAFTLICEALRFQYVFDELVRRIQYGEDSSPLDIADLPSERVWKRIGSWGVMCEVALEAGLNDGLLRTRDKMRDYDRIYHINSFLDMMNGLSVLKRIEKSHLIPPVHQRTPAYGMPVLEPGFIPLDQEYPPDNW
uniref:rRNA N-glycosylase n=3 Tax=Aegilops tauschii TaxID=37682 RepID=A0A453C7U9_AEGTS